MKKEGTGIIRKIFSTFLTIVFASNAVAVYPSGGVCLQAAVPLHKNSIDYIKGGFYIPSHLGSVTSYVDSGGGRTIINVQDVHGNQQAASSIAGILRYLSRVCGVRLAALEGASKDFDSTDSLKLYEAAAVEGVEDEALYARHLAAGTVQAHPDVKELVGALNNFIQKTSAIIGAGPTPAGKDVFNLMRLYWEKKTSVEKLLVVLGEALPSPVLKKYTAAAAAVKAIKIGNGLDFAVVEVERAKAVRELSGLLSDAEKIRLARMTAGYRLFRVSGPEYHSYLGMLMAAFPGMSERYPALRSYISMKAVQQEAPAADVLKDVWALMSEAERLLFSKQEQDMVSAVRFCDVFGRYLSGKADRLEADYTGRAVNDEALRRILENGGISWARVVKAHKRQSEFYAIAQERDAALFRNTLSAMEEKGESAVVLVTGGFHSEGIGKLAREHGCSFIQITPCVIGPDPLDEARYVSRKENDTSPAEDLVQALDEFLAPSLGAGQAFKKLRGEFPQVWAGCDFNSLGGLSEAGQIEVIKKAASAALESGKGLGIRVFDNVVYIVLYDGRSLSYIKSAGVSFEPSSRAEYFNAENAWIAMPQPAIARFDEEGLNLQVSREVPGWLKETAGTSACITHAKEQAAARAVLGNAAKAGGVAAALVVAALFIVGIPRIAGEFLGRVFNPSPLPVTVAPDVPTEVAGQPAAPAPNAAPAPSAAVPPARKPAATPAPVYSKEVQAGLIPLATATPSMVVVKNTSDSYIPSCVIQVTITTQSKTVTQVHPLDGILAGEQTGIDIEIPADMQGASQNAQVSVRFEGETQEVESMDAFVTENAAPQDSAGQAPLIADVAKAAQPVFMIGAKPQASNSAVQAAGVSAADETDLNFVVPGGMPDIIKNHAAVLPGPAQGISGFQFGEWASSAQGASIYGIHVDGTQVDAQGHAVISGQIKGIKPGVEGTWASGGLYSNVNRTKYPSGFDMIARSIYMGPGNNYGMPEGWYFPVAFQAGKAPVYVFSIKDTAGKSLDIGIWSNPDVSYISFIPVKVPGLPVDIERVYLQNPGRYPNPRAIAQWSFFPTPEWPIDEHTVERYTGDTDMSVVLPGGPGTNIPVELKTLPDDGRQVSHFAQGFTASEAGIANEYSIPLAAVDAQGKHINLRYKIQENYALDQPSFSFEVLPRSKGEITWNEYVLTVTVPERTNFSDRAAFEQAVNSAVAGRLPLSAQDYNGIWAHTTQLLTLPWPSLKVNLHESIPGQPLASPVTVDADQGIFYQKFKVPIKVLLEQGITFKLDHVHDVVFSIGSAGYDPEAASISKTTQIKFTPSLSANNMYYVPGAMLRGLFASNPLFADPDAVVQISYQMDRIGEFKSSGLGTEPAPQVEKIVYPGNEGASAQPLNVPGRSGWQAASLFTRVISGTGGNASAVETQVRINEQKYAKGSSSAVLQNPEWIITPVTVAGKTVRYIVEANAPLGYTEAEARSYYTPGRVAAELQGKYGITKVKSKDAQAISAAIISFYAKRAEVTLPLDKAGSAAATVSNLRYFGSLGFNLPKGTVQNITGAGVLRFRITPKTGAQLPSRFAVTYTSDGYNPDTPGDKQIITVTADRTGAAGPSLTFEVPLAKLWEYYRVSAQAGAGTYADPSKITGFSIMAIPGENAQITADLFNTSFDFDIEAGFFPVSGLPLSMEAVSHSTSFRASNMGVAQAGTSDPKNPLVIDLTRLALDSSGTPQAQARFKFNTSNLPSESGVSAWMKFNEAVSAGNMKFSVDASQIPATSREFYVYLTLEDSTMVAAPLPAGKHVIYLPLVGKNFASGTVTAVETRGTRILVKGIRNGNTYDFDLSAHYAALKAAYEKNKVSGVKNYFANPDDIRALSLYIPKTNNGRTDFSGTMYLNIPMPKAEYVDAVVSPVSGDTTTPFLAPANAGSVKTFTAKNAASSAVILSRATIAGYEAINLRSNFDGAIDPKNPPYTGMYMTFETLNTGDEFVTIVEGSEGAKIKISFRDADGNALGKEVTVENPGAYGRIKINLKALGLTQEQIDALRTQGGRISYTLVAGQSGAAWMKVVDASRSQAALESTVPLSLAETSDAEQPSSIPASEVYAVQEGFADVTRGDTTPQGAVPIYIKDGRIPDKGYGGIAAAGVNYQGSQAQIVFQLKDNGSRTVVAPDQEPTQSSKRLRAGFMVRVEIPRGTGLDPDVYMFPFNDLDSALAAFKSARVPLSNADLGYAIPTGVPLNIGVTVAPDEGYDMDVTDFTINTGLPGSTVIRNKMYPLRAEDAGAVQPTAVGINGPYKTSIWTQDGAGSTADSNMSFGKLVPEQGGLIWRIKLFIKALFRGGQSYESVDAPFTFAPGTGAYGFGIKVSFNEVAGYDPFPEGASKRIISIRLQDETGKTLDAGMEITRDQWNAMLKGKEKVLWIDADSITKSHINPARIKVIGYGAEGLAIAITSGPNTSAGQRLPNAFDNMVDDLTYEQGLSQWNTVNYGLRPGSKAYGWGESPTGSQPYTDYMSTWIMDRDPANPVFEGGAPYAYRFIGNAPNSNGFTVEGVMLNGRKGIVLNVLLDAISAIDPAAKSTFVTVSVTDSKGNTKIFLKKLDQETLSQMKAGVVKLSVLDGQTTFPQEEFDSTGPLSVTLGFNGMSKVAGYMAALTQDRPAVDTLVTDARVVNGSAPYQALPSSGVSVSGYADNKDPNQPNKNNYFISLVSGQQAPMEFAPWHVKFDGECEDSCGVIYDSVVMSPEASGMNLSVKIDSGSVSGSVSEDDPASIAYTITDYWGRRAIILVKFTSQAQLDKFILDGVNTITVPRSVLQDCLDLTRPLKLGTGFSKFASVSARIAGVSRQEPVSLNNQLFDLSVTQSPAIPPTTLQKQSAGHDNIIQHWTGEGSDPAKNSVYHWVRGLITGLYQIVVNIIAAQKPAGITLLTMDPGTRAEGGYLIPSDGLNTVVTIESASIEDPAKAAGLALSITDGKKQVIIGRYSVTSAAVPAAGTKLGITVPAQILAAAVQRGGFNSPVRVSLGVENMRVQMAVEGMTEKAPSGDNLSVVMTPANPPAAASDLYLTSQQPDLQQWSSGEAGTNSLALRTVNVSSDFFGPGISVPWALEARVNAQQSVGGTLLAAGGFLLDKAPGFGIKINEAASTPQERSAFLDNIFSNSSKPEGSIGVSITFTAGDGTARSVVSYIPFTDGKVEANDLVNAAMGDSNAAAEIISNLKAAGYLDAKDRLIQDPASVVLQGYPSYQDAVRKTLSGMWAESILSTVVSGTRVYPFPQASLDHVRSLEGGTLQDAKIGFSFTGLKSDAIYLMPFSEERPLIEVNYSGDLDVAAGRVDYNQRKLAPSSAGMQADLSPWKYGEGASILITPAAGSIPGFDTADGNYKMTLTIPDKESAGAALVGRQAAGFLPSADGSVTLVFNGKDVVADGNYVKLSVRLQSVEANPDDVIVADFTKTMTVQEFNEIVRAQGGVYRVTISAQRIAAARLTGKALKVSPGIGSQGGMLAGTLYMAKQTDVTVNLTQSFPIADVIVNPQTAPQHFVFGEDSTAKVYAQGKENYLWQLASASGLWAIQDTFSPLTMSKEYAFAAADQRSAIISALSARGLITAVQSSATGSYYKWTGAANPDAIRSALAAAGITDPLDTGRVVLMYTDMVDPHAPAMLPGAAGMIRVFAHAPSPGGWSSLTFSRADGQKIDLTNGMRFAVNLSYEDYAALVSSSEEKPVFSLSAQKEGKGTPVALAFVGTAQKEVPVPVPGQRVWVVLEAKWDRDIQPQGFSEKVNSVGLSMAGLHGVVYVDVPSDKLVRYIDNSFLTGQRSIERYLEPRAPQREPSQANGEKISIEGVTSSNEGTVTGAVISESAVISGSTVNFKAVDIRTQGMKTTDFTFVRIVNDVRKGIFNTGESIRFFIKTPNAGELPNIKMAFGQHIDRVPQGSIAARPVRKITGTDWVEYELTQEMLIAGGLSLKDINIAWVMIDGNAHYIVGGIVPGWTRPQQISFEQRTPEALVAAMDENAPQDSLMPFDSVAGSPQSMMPSLEPEGGAAPVQEEAAFEQESLLVSSKGVRMPGLNGVTADRRRSQIETVLKNGSGAVVSFDLFVDGWLGGSKDIKNKFAAEYDEFTAMCADRFSKKTGLTTGGGLTGGWAKDELSTFGKGRVLAGSVRLDKIGISSTQISSGGVNIELASVFVKDGVVMTMIDAAFAERLAAMASEAKTQAGRLEAQNALLALVGHEVIELAVSDMALASLGAAAFDNNKERIFEAAHELAKEFEMRLCGPSAGLAASLPFAENMATRLDDIAYEELFGEVVSRGMCDPFKVLFRGAVSYPCIDFEHVYQIYEEYKRGIWSGLLTSVY